MFFYNIAPSCESASLCLQNTAPYSKAGLLFRYAVMFWFLILPASLWIFLGGGAPEQCFAETRSSDCADSHDFGSVHAGAWLTHRFNIPNEAGTPFLIRNARTSSDSVQVLAYTQKVTPGRSGYVEVRWIPDQTGNVEGEIVLETDRSPDAALRFVVKGAVQEGGGGAAGTQEESDISGVLLTRRLRACNPSFLISVESVLKRLKNRERTILIDVRNAWDFQKFRIPGSINIPLFSVKEKAFLKSCPIVLVEEGYGYSNLEKECERLKESGFLSVWILDGGMRSWECGGGQIEGDVFAINGLSKVPTREFFNEKDYDHWTLVDIGPEGGANARWWMPQSVARPFPGNKDDFIAQVKAMRKPGVEGRRSLVLLYDAKGEHSEAVDHLLREANMDGVFYLEGGANAYKAFLMQQAAAWQQKTSVIRTERKCAHCP
jgi:rhodanese-related sulfurtransferase